MDLMELLNPKHFKAGTDINGLNGIELFKANHFKLVEQILTDPMVCNYLKQSIIKRFSKL